MAASHRRECSHDSAPYGTFAQGPAIRFGIPPAGPMFNARLVIIVMFLVISLSCLAGPFDVQYRPAVRSLHTTTMHHMTPLRFAKEVPVAGPTEPHYQYGIMMDLGSSGSRLYVYRWQPALALRSIIQLGQQSTNPGVSWYVSNAIDSKSDKEAPLRVGTSLLPLVNFARTIIPPDAATQTPIHAKCTAGCRTLDPDGVATVMKGVRMVLATSGFKFRSSFVEEMPGDMEAILDWVSINAALGLLHQPTYYQTANQVFISPTVGVMDIGGASAQIAYPVLSAAMMAPKETARSIVKATSSLVQRPVVFSYGHGLYHLRLVNGVEHTIYAVSRIHYGMHDAQKLVISKDVDHGITAASTGRAAIRTQGSKNEGELRYHPCMQRGVYERSRAGNLVTGTGNAEACLKAVQDFFTKAEAEDLGNVSWATPVPQFNLPFLPFAAMNNFYRLHRFALYALGGRLDEELGTQEGPRHKKHNITGPFNVDSLMHCMEEYPTSHAKIFSEAAKVTCPVGFDELQLLYGALLDADRLKDSCFGLVYMSVLLSSVYEFAKNQRFHPMHATSRCPGLVLPDVDKQFQGASYSQADEQKNVHAMYSSSWTLGGMVLEMEETEATPLFIS